MSDNPRLHKESPPEGVIPDDTECLAALAEYERAEYLGSGVHGIALQVYHKTKDTLPLVIKIMARDDDAAMEIDKGFRVTQKLVPWSRGVFSRIHGWIACGPVTIPTWVPHIVRGMEIEAAKNPKEKPDFNPLAEPCLFLVSEHGGGPPLKQFSFANLRQCQGFLFEVFYALHEAVRRHRYQHNDLHAGNVIVAHGIVEPRSYTLPNLEQAEVVVEATIRPTIIDYGLSTFGAAEELLDAKAYAQKWFPGSKLPRDTKLSMYRNYLFGENPDRFDKYLTSLHQNYNRMGPLRDVFKLTRWVYQNANNPIDVQPWVLEMLKFAAGCETIAELIASKFFSALRTAKEAEPSVAKRPKTLEFFNCLVCGRVATQVYQHAPTYRFCNNEACAKAMGPIGWMVQ